MNNTPDINEVFNQMFKELDKKLQSQLEQNDAVSESSLKCEPWDWRWRAEKAEAEVRRLQSELDWLKGNRVDQEPHG